MSSLEEGPSRGRAETARVGRLFVDPLDGTTNFLKGIPHFAIAIALETVGPSWAAWS